MKKKASSFNEMVDEITKEGVTTWYDKLTFVNIFAVWALVVMSFGIIYFLFRSDASYLFFTGSRLPLTSLFDHIYFSFITATTTGFGDIVPVGVFRLIAILEVTFGLLLLAFVTSKLVSIKQDVILNEIYEISFNEKINRLRSSFSIFRNNANRMINNIEDGSIRKKEIYDIYVYLSYLEDTLKEIVGLIKRPAKNTFTKNLDSLSTELLLNSMVDTLGKLNELITALNEKKLEWKRDLTVELINRDLALVNSVFEVLDSSNNLPEKAVKDLAAQKNKMEELIKAGIEAKHETKTAAN